MATTMYRVGDYVYVETTPGSPYLIRRIEELNKNQSGNVEAKMMCFYRRRDLPNPLVQLADKHQPALDEDRTSPIHNTSASGGGSGSAGSGGNGVQATTTGSVTTSSGNADTKNTTTNVYANANEGKGGESLTSKQRYQIKHRELFLSRQVETLPATQIRGKCSVTLLNETESLQSYLNKDDTFFYCLVFDPNQKTLLADKGEIRVGSRYQSEIPAKLKDPSSDERKLEDLESLVWTPQHELNDRKIDQFLVVSRSIGTFARALDCSSSVKQPSLHMSAAAASRDITLFHAMDLLHQHSYSIEEAMCSLVPSSGPVLCRDEIEDWSAAEANLFEEALDKYGKDFNDIRQDFLPWKTLKQIIEYYYMWKTTDRYVQQKRVKAVEAELKLKQVYVPHYNNNNNNNNKSAVNAAALNAANVLKNSGVSIYNGTSNTTNGGASDFFNNSKPCESCAVLKSSQWYPWTAGHLTCRLCQSCWDYWKKYGGLKMVAKHNNNEHVANANSDSGELKKKLPTQMTVELIGSGVGSGGSSGSVSGSGITVGGLGGISVVIADDDKISDLSSRQLHKCSIVNCGKEFKLKTHLARHYAQAHGIALSSSSPRPIMKTRTAFYLHANAMTRLARILCRELIKPRRAARQTSYAINTQLIKQEFGTRVVGKTPAEMKLLLLLKKKDRGSVTKIANRLGSPGIGPHEWLILTPRDKMPLPDIVYFPKPPKGPDGSLLYERIPNKIPELDKDLTIMPANLAVAATHQTLRKRIHEEQQLNGTDVTIVPTGPPSKRPNKDPMPSHCPSPEQFAAMMAASGQPLTRHHLNGKPKIAQMARIGNGRKQVISWMDAPDDVYFRATKASKRARQILAPVDVRRAARKPWRNLSIKPIMLGAATNNSRPMESQVVILD